MNQKTTMIIAIAVFICFLAFAVVMMLLIKENNKCVGNPFIYAIEKIDTKEKVLCSCNVGLDTFYFDIDGLYKENPLFKHINITERGLT